MMTGTIDKERLVYEIEDMEEEWLGWRIHLVFYLVINAAMAFFDLYVEGGQMWFFWPLAAWGSGVLVHYLGLAQHERSLERRAERAGIPLAELR